MTIVDKQHGAEAVSTKGKVFKYDAIECMIRYLNENKHRKYAHILVNDYNQAGILVNAVESTFLISPAIPSPMGAYLSAFSDSEEAKALQNVKGGETYNWTEIQSTILNTNILSSYE